MAGVEEFLEGPYGWTVIFAIIIIFTLLTILYYTKKDKYDPEPPGRLILAFFFGILSVIPALIMSIIGLLIVGGNPLLLAVLVAPITEEIAKIWFVIWLAKSDTFDGPLDGLVYGAMVGAGFAAAENLLYGFGALAEGGIVTGLALTTFRSLFQIVGHPLYTGLAGVGVGEWKVGLEGGKYNKIWRSMLFHGLWNFSANLSPFVLTLVALLVVVGINIYVLRKELKRTLELDRDAYERGYYEEKKRRREMKEQGLQQQIDQRPWQQSPQHWNQPSGLQNQPPEMGSSPEIMWPVDQSNEQDKPADASPNFCKLCGTRREQGDIYCRNCGYKMV